MHTCPIPNGVLMELLNAHNKVIGAPKLEYCQNLSKLSSVSFRVDWHYVACDLSKFSDLILLCVWWNFTPACLFLEGDVLDDFLPISARDSQKGMETCNEYVTVKTLTSNGTKSVSTHYQNDGSHLYLLTPNILPPSVGTVHRWLLCNKRGIY